MGGGDGKERRGEGWRKVEGGVEGEKDGRERNRGERRKWKIGCREERRWRGEGWKREGWKGEK